MPGNIADARLSDGPLEQHRLPPHPLCLPADQRICRSPDPRPSSGYGSTNTSGATHTSEAKILRGPRVVYRGTALARKRHLLNNLTCRK